MLQVQDEMVGWDPVHMWRPVPTITRIYVLFVLVTLIVGCAKLMRLWIAVPPFRLSRQANRPDYFHHLQRSCNSLKQWMACTLLVSGLSAGISTTGMCERLLETRAGINALLFSLRDISVGLSFGVVVALVLFLMRWHVLKRMESLSQ